MNYAKKIIVIMICVMLVFSNAVWAKEEGIFCVSGYIFRKDEKVMPKSSTEFEKMGRQKVEILNAIENFEIPDQGETPKITTPTKPIGAEPDNANPIEKTGESLVSLRN